MEEQQQQNTSLTSNSSVVIPKLKLQQVPPPQFPKNDKLYTVKEVGLSGLIFLF
jgi:hypothetical protein